MNEILYDGSYKIYKSGDKEIINPPLSAAVLPYKGRYEKFLIRFENNPAFYNKSAITIITELIVNNESPIEAAVRGVITKGGYNIQPYFLDKIGEIRLGKNSFPSEHLFTVNVSKLKDKNIKGNKWVDKDYFIHLVSKSDCSILHSMFSKLVSLGFIL